MRTLLAPRALEPNQHYELDADESRHGRSVLRLQPGDEVRLIDGICRSATAVVDTVGKKSLCCQTTSQIDQEAPLAASLLHVFVAAPKGSRFEDMVRGLCEIGVGAITPIRCERSVRDPQVSRAQRVAREASKQCGRAGITQVNAVQDFTTLADTGVRLILLDPQGQAADVGKPTATGLVIGPEGGFSDDELDQLQGWGASAVKLASTILRIETAALAAAAVWTAAWEHTSA